MNNTSIPRTISDTDDLMSPSLIFLALLCRSVVGCFIYCSNILILVVVVSRLKYTKKTTRIFIVNLAVADLLVGIDTTIHSIVLLSSGVQTKTLCLSLYATLITTCGSSATDILFMCISNYLTIRRISSENSRMSKQIFILLLSISWTYMVYHWF